MHRLIRHVRSNAISYLALFVALGGTSYAAINLPAGSVGPRQLKKGAVTTSKLANGSVTPKKLDSKAFGGGVLHWAHVSEDGRVISGSRGAHASVAAAQYTLGWGDQFSSRCAVLVTPAAVPGIAPIADRTGVGINPGHGNDKTLVYVWTYGDTTPTRAPFYVAVVC